jgi:hypothetical protein
MMREASMRPDFLNASTQVDAGSQQFDNLGPYVLSDRISMTASAKMEYFPFVSHRIYRLIPDSRVVELVWKATAGGKPADWNGNGATRRRSISLWNACCHHEEILDK